MSLRMLWTYEHPTARLQEMMLFPEIGIEAIPTFTDSQTSWIDNKYHDESHAMYPRWRDYVSLPVNVVERIRRMQLWERNFNITIEEQELINSTIDIIFINCSPETLDQILSWYRGYILFRCNGGPNSKLLFEDSDKWVDVALKHDAIKRFIYIPSTLSLINEKMANSGAPIVNMPVYVDASRIPSSWAGNISRKIASAVSYLDFHEHFQKQFKTMAKSYIGAPIKMRVFGKNRVTETPSANIEIVGGLPDEKEFWGQIFDCDVFVDAGTDPTHNIFPPLEAMAKGMPVLFSYGNGNVEAIEKAYKDLKVSPQIGVFENHDEIVKFLKKDGAKKEKLVEIWNNQIKYFMEYFSKANALRAASEIRDYIYGRQIPCKILAPTQLSELPKVEVGKPLRSVAPKIEDISQINFGALILRTGSANEDGSLSFENLKSVTEEQFLCEYLPQFETGEYEISVEYETSENKKSKSAGRIEYGIWERGTTYKPTIVDLKPKEKSGKIKVKIDDENKFYSQELRLSVYRDLNVNFKKLVLKKIN